MGSVKDLTILETAYEDRIGHGIFSFSDRYSVFDWGQMPDMISNKGAALAAMAAFNFEGLEKQGIKSHYRALQKNGIQFQFDQIQKHGAACEMAVDIGCVYKPVVRKFFNNKNPDINYDYSFFDTLRGKLNNYLVGLEVIFRNALPEGSSVFRKIAEAEKDPDSASREKKIQKILQSLGVNHIPAPGEFLPKPVLSFTTKLEPSDRALTEDEAFYISGLTEKAFEELKKKTLIINEFITAQAKKAGMVHYDGKVEFLYADEIVLCDVLGTFDENRLGYKNIQVSKELLRQWYEKKQPEFREACEQHKKSGEGWQEKCTVKPKPLPAEFVKLISDMYCAGCNQYTGVKVFDTDSFDSVMQTLNNERIWSTK